MHTGVLLQTYDSKYPYCAKSLSIIPTKDSEKTLKPITLASWCLSHKPRNRAIKLFCWLFFWSSVLSRLLLHEVANGVCWRKLLVLPVSSIKDDGICHIQMFGGGCFSSSNKMVIVARGVYRWAARCAREVSDQFNSHIYMYINKYEASKCGLLSLRFSWQGGYFLPLSDFSPTNKRFFPSIINNK